MGEREGRVHLCNALPVISAIVMTLTLTANSRTTCAVRNLCPKSGPLGDPKSKWGKGYYKGRAHFCSACLSVPTTGSAIAAGHSAVLP